MGAIEETHWDKRSLIDILYRKKKNIEEGF